MVVNHGGKVLICAAALLGAACSGQDLGLRPDGGEPDGPDAGAITSADQLYSGEQVPVFQLTLSAEAIAALEAAPKDYVQGDFRYGHITLPGVGIRLKGSATLQLFDQKPSFKIKFNAYDHTLAFLGLESLTLNNLDQD